VVYTAEGLGVDLTAAQVRTQLLGAVSEEGEELSAAGLTLTVKAGEEAGQWTVSFGMTSEGLTPSGLRTALLTPDEEAPAEPAPDVPAEPVKGAMAVGGLVVRNDVRAVAQAYIRFAKLTAGSVSVAVSEAASIEASLEAVAEASGGTGKGLAVGGAIATNLILNQSAAFISDSSITTEEDGVSVEASNTASISATNNSAISSDGTAVGVTLAFNTIGWQAQNVLFAAIDALVGSEIGDEEKAQVKAYLHNTDVDSAGAVTVTATNEAEILSEIKNEVSSQLPEPPSPLDSATGAEGAGGGAAGGATGAASGAAGAAAPAKSVSAGFVLASNMVSSAALATITHDAAKTPLTMRDLTVGAGGLSVSATDDARIVSKVDLSVVSGEESELTMAMRAFVNLFGVTYTDMSGTQRVIFGDRVRVGGPTYTTFDRPEAVTAGDRVELKSSLGGGQAGDLYEYIGEEDLEEPRLDKTDFSDTELWRQVQGSADTTYVFKGSDSIFDLGSEDFNDSSRWLAIDLDGLVDVAAAAVEAAATLKGSVSGGDSGSSAFGGLVVRNDVRSDVDSLVDGFAMDITGDVSITATESAIILAQDNSTVEAKTTGFNVVVATNTILGGANAVLRNSTLVTLAEEAAPDAPPDEAAPEEAAALAEATTGDEATTGEAATDEGEGEEEAAEPMTGSVTVSAESVAFILAEVNSSVKASTSVGVVMAFNTIGYTPQNVLYNIVDGVLGTSLAGQNKLSTTARIESTPLELAGDLNVAADSDGQIQALIINSALALDVSTKADSKAITVAPVIAMNKIAANTDATIDKSATCGGRWRCQHPGQGQHPHRVGSRCQRDRHFGQHHRCQQVGVGGREPEPQRRAKRRQRLGARRRAGHAH
jgi:hypothetical protein